MKETAATPELAPRRFLSSALTRAREFLMHAFAGQNRVVLLWSALLIAGIAVLVRDLPLVGCILVIQWIFSSAFRRVIAALMLSLIVAYVGVIYLTVQGLWTLPWLESAAIFIAIAIGYLGRARHELVLQRIIERNASAEAEQALKNTKAEGESVRDLSNLPYPTDCDARLNTAHRQ